MHNERTNLQDLTFGGRGPSDLASQVYMINCFKALVHIPNFGGLSGSEDRGGGDNSIQFINFGRVGDKSFEKWQKKVGGWKGG